MAGYLLIKFAKTT